MPLCFLEVIKWDKSFSAFQILYNQASIMLIFFLVLLFPDLVSKKLRNNLTWNKCMSGRGFCPFRFPTLCQSVCLNYISCVQTQKLSLWPLNGIGSLPIDNEFQINQLSCYINAICIYYPYSYLPHPFFSWKQDLNSLFYPSHMLTEYFVTFAR